MLQIVVDTFECRGSKQNLRFSRKLLKMHEAKYEPMDKVFVSNCKMYLSQIAKYISMSQ